MAEVLSMLPDENGGELNADEQDSLKVGEEMQEAQDQRLAGKYKNAEELEAAYIELQKKLGAPKESSETPEAEPEAESTEDTPTDSSLFDRLWEESSSEFTDETLKELAGSKPEDLAKMYLDYRSKNAPSQISEADTAALKNSVGGDEAYGQMMSWAEQNLNEAEINMYDSVMELGDPNAAYFAIQALNFRFRDTTGIEGNLLQGKAAASTPKGFKSQAEVVSAMQDPRYDRDPAYRQEVMAKLESSNINF